MKFAVPSFALILAISGVAASVTARQAPVRIQTMVFWHQAVSSAMPFPGCDTVQQGRARGK